MAMTVEEKQRKDSMRGEEEDRSEEIVQEVERLFRHDGGDPLMRGVKAALIEFRTGK